PPRTPNCPTIARRSVDLPVPFGPTIASRPPAGTSAVLGAVTALSTSSPQPTGPSRSPTSGPVKIGLLIRPPCHGVGERGVLHPVRIVVEDRPRRVSCLLDHRGVGDHPQEFQRGGPARLRPAEHVPLPAQREVQFRELETIAGRGECGEP